MSIIPADIEIRSTIRQGSVYYYQDYELYSSEPHYFIVINKNPKQDNFLFFVTATTKIQKKEKYVKIHKFPKETLVYIKPEEYKELKCNTTINCNDLKERTIEYIIEKREHKVLKICEEIDNDLIKKIQKGINLSPSIDDEKKRMIL